MSEDFYRALESTYSTRIIKVKQVEREQGIRLYCEQAKSSWCLQVRGPMRIGAGFEEGKDFIVASAMLSRNDLRELRDACDAFLREVGDQDDAR